MNNPPSLDNNLLESSPIDAINLRLLSENFTYRNLEIAHHRVSGSNIIFYTEDFDDSYNSTTIFNAIVEIVTGGGGDIYFEEEMEEFSLRYRDAHKSDPLIELSDNVSSSISLNPFFYFCLEFNSSKNNWIFNMSLNHHKEKIIKDLSVGRDLEQSIFSINKIIKERVLGE